MKKYKIGAVCLALFVVFIYSRTILNFNNRIDASNCDENGMYSGVIINDSIYADGVSVGDNENYEPAVFYTNEALELKQFDPSDWKYILVNKDNPISEDFECELKGFCGYSVDERIYDELILMFKDAASDGITLSMASGYRTENDQIFLYNRKVNQYRNTGLSKDEAEVNAAMIVTPPNTSEHQTGLAVDILSPSYNSMDWNFGKTDAGAWLAENCTKYGFILRYPIDSEDITQIIYEPWHFRYVGVEAAEYITENNLTYEEFYDLILKAND